MYKLPYLPLYTFWSFTRNLGYQSIQYREHPTDDGIYYCLPECKTVQDLGRGTKMKTDDDIWNESRTMVRVAIYVL